MKARWLAVIILAAVAASVLFWGLTSFVLVARPPAIAGVRTPTMAPPGDLTPLRGNDPSPIPVPAVALAAESARFQLIGVIAPRDPNSGSQGVALIVIDGKPAQAFRVGDMLDSDRVLQAVQMRGVSIGPRGGATLISLQLPAPESAANANLEAGASDSGQASMQTRPSRQISIGRPPMPGINSLHGSAPNTLLNNPADMAPADASGSDAPPSR